MHLTIWDVLNVSRIVACVTFTISSVSRILSGDPGPSWPPGRTALFLDLAVPGSLPRAGWGTCGQTRGVSSSLPCSDTTPPPPPCGRWAGGCPAVWAVGRAVPVWWSTAPGTWLIDGRVRRGSASRPAWC